MGGRTIAIGDIHGCLVALEALLEAIEPTAEDTLVVLGDFVDRGPDSRGVIDRLMALAGACRLVTILGNHEEMMLSACDGESSRLLNMWLQCGGAAMLNSYGYGVGPDGLPEEHVEFVRQCVEWYETDTHAFLHASYDANEPLTGQEAFRLRWESLRDRIPPRHISGKTIFLGHTPQPEGEILDRGYLKCIDTGCYAGGWLTAMDVASERLWQANQAGELRGEA